MLLHELGYNNEKVIVMIHGLAMSWDMLLPAAELLSRDYRVYMVAVPGMDMDEENEFTSVEEIAEDIENELAKKGVSEAACIYGLSMGGGIALRMLATGHIHFENAVIDAGITPYELPHAVTRMILVRDVLMTLLARASKRMLEFAFPPKDYSQNAVDEMYAVMKHMTLATIRSAYDSTDNYSMPENVDMSDTNVWYWYGEREMKERKMDLQYMRKHLPHARFRRLPDMAHGQYIISEPERCTADIKRVIEHQKSVPV